MGTFYKIFNEETGYSRDVYDIPKAKKLMKEHNAKCEMWSTWYNGDRKIVCAIDKKGKEQPLHFNKLQL